MIVKYSSLNRLEKPLFTLCNPGSTHKSGVLSSVVGILTDTEAEEISFNFKAIPHKCHNPHYTTGAK